MIDGASHGDADRPPHPFAFDPPVDVECPMDFNP